MEENTTNNKNNKVLIIILVILIFLVGGLGFYLGGVFHKTEEIIIDDNNNSSKKEENNKQEENNKETNAEEETTSSKETFTIISQKDTSKLSSGDQVKLSSEEFYVVSSDDTNTILLAKYNLYVGNVIKEVEIDGIAESWDAPFKYIKTITKDDSKYGLQSSDAKGYIGKEIEAVGVVGFSGDTYWLKNGKLKSNYKANNVYDSSLSKTAMDTTDNHLEVKNKKYTIAYFVEEYVNKLKTLTDSSVKGRLLLVSELKKLGCKVTLEEQGGRCDDAPDWLFTSSYWLGSYAGGSDRIGYFIANIEYKANEVHNPDEEEDETNIYFEGDYFDARYFGVRPVIIVKTIDIK